MTLARVNVYPALAAKQSYRALHLPVLAADNWRHSFSDS
jgi:hypothetical protein